jgi:hypothetical protein
MQQKNAFIDSKEVTELLTSCFLRVSQLALQANRGMKLWALTLLPQ